MLTDKAVVYIKRPGEPHVPVTVRVEWLSDGKIKPLMYWTPDGTCYEVKHVYEFVKRMFLKDYGEGIRYRVRAELRDIPEHGDLRYVQHETYLYIADNRFCEKGFIDERYYHSSKKYVPVTLEVFPGGDYELMYFEVDNKRYMVERTNDKEQCGSFAVGGIGIKHDVDVRLVNPDNDNDPNPQISIRRKGAIYLELDKWFVSYKAA